MAFTYRYNPLSKKFDVVQDSSLLTLKGVVDTTNDLPLTGNSKNDLYVVSENDRLFTWNKPTDSGILADWVDVGSVTSIDWSIITNKPTSGVGDIDDAVTKKHTQNTDTILTTDGIITLFNAGILKRNLLVDNTFNIQIDEIRARDIDGLKLYDDDGNGIFIKDGGSIGIGTNIPNSSSKLEISSTTQGFLPPRMTAVQRDDIVSPAPGLTLYDKTNNKMDFYNDTVWRSFVSTSVSTLTPGGIVFATEGHHVEDDPAQLHWDNINNRMGIGTNTPTVPLDVVGDINTSTDYNIGNTQVLSLTTLGSGVTSSSLTSVGGLSSLTMAGTLNMLNNQIKFSGGAGNNFIRGNVSNTGRLGFFTDDTEIITITLQGNVGIGDSTPDGKLEVRQTGTGDIFNLYDSGTNVFTVLDGGNVGIGTNSPSSKLEVIGKVKIGNIDEVALTTLHILDTSPTIRLSSGGTGNTGGFEISLGSVVNFKGLGNNDYLFSTNNTEKMRITVGGNVGIGTTTPDALLDIETTGAGVTTSLRIHNAEGTNGASHAQLELRTETAFSGDPSILFTVGGQGNWIMGTDNGDTDAFKISKSTVLGTLTRLKIDHLGNVEFLSTGGAIIPNRVTTTQRDNFVTTVNGMIIYNTTLEKFQGRENGVWTNLIQ